MQKNSKQIIFSTDKNNNIYPFLDLLANKVKKQLNNNKSK